jgi:hypothetical protein
VEYGVRAGGPDGRVPVRTAPSADTSAVLAIGPNALATYEAARGDAAEPVWYKPRGVERKALSEKRIKTAVRCSLFDI